MNPDENIDDSCEQCGLWLCDCEEDELYEDELERTYDGDVVNEAFSWIYGVRGGEA